MFTIKAVVYFSLALLVLTLGLVLNDFQLAVLVLPIASLFVFANVWGLPEKLNLKISRTIQPSETFGNEDVQVKLEVQNDSGHETFNIELREDLPANITIKKGSPQVLAPLTDSVSITYQFSSPQRGQYDIGPLKVTARDPLGFYFSQTLLEPDSLFVIPRPEKMRGVQLRPRHLGPWPGSIQSRLLGSGTEFYSMRSYVPGDDPKKINWKATARYNRLVVNETEAERVTNIMIVLDADIAFSDSSQAEFERRVIGAASLASMFLRQGNRVGLVLHGDERGTTPAGFGKRHEQRILFLLALARPGKATVGAGYVSNLLARRMLPVRSQVVMISPLLDPEIVQGARDLAAAGYRLLVIAPSSLPRSTFHSKTEELAYRLMMLERSNTLLALEKVANVVHWPTETLLSVQLGRMREARSRMLA